MTSAFSKDFYKPENLKNTWEYKTIRFLLRGFLTLFVYCLLLYMWPNTQTWAYMQYVRAQDMSTLEPMLAKAEKTGDFEWPLRWVTLRPAQDAPAIIETIRQHAETLPPAFFSYAAAQSEKLGRQDEYLLWTMLTRYRLRYDVLRCGDPNAVNNLAKMFDALYKIYGTRDDVAALAAHPPLLVKALRAVMDFDAEHPARNDPRMTCEMLKALHDENEKITYKPIKESDWAKVRHSLRNVTDYEIDKMQAEVDAQPGKKGAEKSGVKSGPQPATPATHPAHKP